MGRRKKKVRAQQEREEFVDWALSIGLVEAV